MTREYDMPLWKKRRGVSTIVALVCMAVVASTVLLITQTVVRERRADAEKMRYLQAEVLARDVIRIAEKRNGPVELTVPKSSLDGVADLRFEAVCREGEETPEITVTVVNLAEELPTSMKISLVRTNTRNHAKR